MEIMIQVTAEQSATMLADLQKWLGSDPDLRGATRMVAAAPESGELGGLVDSLVVLLGAGGATAVVRVLSTTVIAWLQRRTGDVKLRITDAGGSILEYSATNVREMTLPEIDATAEELAKWMSRNKDGS
ncbi:hypothetical protein [Nocardia sp. NPDC006630]|uniref:effector-associated constant component EACC1 n=1 Tax=Nocardia sp. NPDC006630 TaxID=3157181 RepID=UPI0033B8BD69